METEEKDSYMTIKEYSDKKRVSVQAVYQKIKRGGLEFKKIGSFYLVKI